MIFTFYSYKGGVGRSMALANIAELYFQAGRRVLIIDWDLDSPGLERYFFDDPEIALDHLGVLDMIIDYKYKMAEKDDDLSLDFKSLDNYVIDIYPEGESKGQFLLMTAGRRSKPYFSKYAETILSFDWKDFYENWEGELYFDWFCEQLNKIADVILIDSRTGITEMGGICTYQLADTIVMFCAPNQQNIDGTYEMAKNFTDKSIRKLRPGRPLNVLVIPARVEDRSEHNYLDLFQKQFCKRFDKFLFGQKTSLPELHSFWNLKIPYVPYYAFNEMLAVKEKNKSETDIVYAFKKLTNIIDKLSGADVELYQNAVIFLCHTPEDGEYAEKLGAKLKAFNLIPWIDRSYVRGKDGWGVLFEEVIKTIDYFLILQSAVLTKEFKGYFFKEINVAIDYGSTVYPNNKFIIPVKIEDYRPLGHGEDELESYQVVDLTNEENIEELVRIIRRDLYHRSNPKNLNL